MYYLIGDLAFIPIQVIVVTLVIDKFVKQIEKRNMAKRINVIISSFFIESGTELMSVMSRFNGNQSEVREILKTTDYSKNTSLKLRICSGRFSMLRTSWTAEISPSFRTPTSTIFQKTF
jgi:hypothetical protein